MRIVLQDYQTEKVHKDKYSLVGDCKTFWFFFRKYSFYYSHRYMLCLNIYSKIYVSRKIRATYNLE